LCDVSNPIFAMWYRDRTKRITEKDSLGKVIARAPAHVAPLPWLHVSMAHVTHMSHTAHTAHITRYIRALMICMYSTLIEATRGDDINLNPINGYPDYISFTKIEQTHLPHIQMVKKLARQQRKFRYANSRVSFPWSTLKKHTIPLTSPSTPSPPKETSTL
jgi:hypothetical protein